MKSKIVEKRNYAVLYCLLIVFLLFLFRKHPRLQLSYTIENVASEEETGNKIPFDANNEYDEDDDAIDDVVTPEEIKSSNQEWPQECNAPRHFLEPAEQRKKPVALASFPGSGNTWLRFLIEQGSRVYTGSAYEDLALNQTYPGENIRNPSVVAVKTHYPCPNCWTYQKCPWCAGTLPVTAEMTGIVKGADAAVFMMRSPFDALLAEFHRLRTGKFDYT